MTYKTYDDMKLNKLALKFEHSLKTMQITQKKS